MMCTQLNSDQYFIELPNTISSSLGPRSDMKVSNFRQKIKNNPQKENGFAAIELETKVK